MSVSLKDASVDAVRRCHPFSLTPNHRGDQPTGNCLGAAEMLGRQCGHEHRRVVAEAAAGVPGVLIANNGDVVPPDLVVEIAQAGGVTTTDAWWVGHSGPTGFFLSDEAIDWIDEVANGETPEPRPDDHNTTS